MKKILILLSLISYISLDIIPNEGYIHYLIIIYKQFVVLLGVITIYINISSCNIEKYVLTKYIRCLKIIVLAYICFINKLFILLF